MSCLPGASRLHQGYGGKTHLSAMDGAGDGLGVLSEAPEELVTKGTSDVR